MSVQNTRVGQVTDFDKLTLDVYTNGTLDTDEAVSLASKVLCEHLKLFIDLSETSKDIEVIAEPVDDEIDKVLEMNIDELGYGREGRRREGKGSGDEYWRAGAFRSFLQLLEESRYQYSWGISK